MKIVPWMIMLALVQVACVSTQKFDALEASKLKVDAQNVQLMADVAKLKGDNANLSQKANLLVECQDQLMTTQTEKEALNQTISIQQQQYDELLQQNQSMLKSAGEEKAVLSDELAEKVNEIDRKERTLRVMERKLMSQEENLKSLQEDVRIRERKLEELMLDLREQDSIMYALRSTITDALTGFSDTDLSVTEREGKVYVSLSQNLLFAKGSNALDAAGKSAIRKLAGILKEHPDILINVEGHTDSDGTPAKNWDLSVTRATAVVKQLTASGLDPSQVTASGRAFYAPIVHNDTEENKSLNRRTEIILAPRLDVLYQMIQP